jgi:hypothetical protein
MVPLRVSSILFWAAPQTPRLILDPILDSHGPPKDPSSFMFWQAINNASVIAQTPGKKIPGMKWGRIDFLTEIELTSRWLLFKYVYPRFPFSWIAY